MSADRNQPEPNNKADSGANKKSRWHKRLAQWTLISIGDPTHLPHYLIAVFTLLLVIFAYYAWDESTKGTAALQDQVLAMKADQRPLMWITGTGTGPVFVESSGQVVWTWSYQNLGKSIAYNVVMNEYIKVGNERYQPGRNIGKDAIELRASRPIDIPPGVKGGFASVASRPGINKDFFMQAKSVDSGIGFLVEFEYYDASGKTRYANTVCFEHLATGTHTIVPPTNCAK